MKVWKIIQYDTRFDPPRVHKTRLSETELGFMRSLIAVKRQTVYPYKVYTSNVKWKEITV